MNLLYNLHVFYLRLQIFWLDLFLWGQPKLLRPIASVECKCLLTFTQVPLTSFFFSCLTQNRAQLYTSVHAPMIYSSGSRRHYVCISHHHAGSSPTNQYIATIKTWNLLDDRFSTIYAFPVNPLAKNHHFAFLTNKILVFNELTTLDHPTNNFETLPSMFRSLSIPYIRDRIPLFKYHMCI